MRRDLGVLEDFGTLLEAWQRSRRFRLSDLARVLPSRRRDSAIGDSAIGDSAISNWKSGRRRFIRNEELQLLDTRLKAGGAFADLARAIGTKDGLRARIEWAHNFVGVGGPIWIWIRPTKGLTKLCGRLNWGPLTMRLDEPCTEEGIFVTAPHCVDNPPLFVVLDNPGWVDFGRGRIPRGLGLHVMSGIRHAKLDRTNVTTRLYGHSFDNLNARLVQESNSAPVPQESAETILDEVFADLAYQTVVRWAREIEPEVPESLLTGPELKKLREHRMLSGQEALRLANELHDQDDGIGPRVSRKVFDRNEKEMLRLDSGVRSRLDVLYGADGWATYEEVALEPSDRTPEPGIKWWCVRFPDFWIGPVWIRAKVVPSSEPICNRLEQTLNLRWGPWRTKVVVDDNEGCFAFRQAGPGTGLDVFAPESWTLTAGIGRVPGATRLDDWAPGDRKSADHVYKIMKAEYLGVVGGTRDGLARFVRRLADHRVEIES